MTADNRDQPGFLQGRSNGLAETWRKPRRMVTGGDWAGFGSARVRQAEIAFAAGEGFVTLADWSPFYPDRLAAATAAAEAAARETGERPPRAAWG